MEELIENIEDRLDRIEEFVDELEDEGTEVDNLRDAIGKVWAALDEIK